MRDIFVSADWLAERLPSDVAARGSTTRSRGPSDLALVDVRDAWEYDGIGHVPGAVSIPFDRFRSEEGTTGMLPPREEWESLLSDAGVAPDDELVAYDDTHGVFAARFLVTAELLGHDPDRLHLLDGDYSAWSREHETSSEAPEPEPTDYHVEPPAETPLVGFEEVQAAVDSDAIVVDTREPEEYVEGHIPGAVQLNWRHLVDEETRGLKPEDELREILESHGVTPDRRVVLYCNTARRISHTYLVLRHLGYENVDFYEGSLTEWEARGGPLETE